MKVAKTLSILLFVMLIFCGAVKLVHANESVYTELACVKVEESNRLGPQIPVNLLTFQEAFEQNGCKLKTKLKRFCVPTQILPSNEDGNVGGQNLLFDYSCYRIKCPKSVIPSAEIMDRFGARLERFGRVKQLCLAAVKVSMPVCMSEECNDGNVCNGVETCQNDVCVPGTPLQCEDGNICNGTETCDPIHGCLPGTIVDCNDGLCCNGEEICDITTGLCVIGTPIDCDDDINCTFDFCDEKTCSCQSVPDHTICDDGLFCNGQEFCDVVLGCSEGASPCTTVENCNEATDECLTCNPALCNDGNVCNGVETCQNDVCVPGTPLQCEDGNICNGTETCDPIHGCLPGEPIICDDGDKCNGLEICDPILGCQSGVPVECDDGEFCNGEETCVEGNCISGENPCKPEEVCDEERDHCVPLCGSDHINSPDGTVVCGDKAYKPPDCSKYIMEDTEQCGFGIINVHNADSDEIVSTVDCWDLPGHDSRNDIKGLACHLSANIAACSVHFWFDRPGQTTRITVFNMINGEVICTIEKPGLLHSMRFDSDGGIILNELTGKPIKIPADEVFCIQ